MDKEIVSLEKYLIEDFSYIFERTVDYLSSTVNQVNEPLALLAYLALIQTLKISDQHEVSHRLISLIENLPAIQESGMPLRDCLLVSGYAYVANLEEQDRKFLEKNVLPRVEYAVAQNWIGGDARLALAISIQKTHSASQLSVDFLGQNIARWLQEKNFQGISCFLISQNNGLGNDLSDYYKTYDWREESLENLAWGLLALGNANRKHGDSLFDIQNNLAKTIQDRLRAYFGLNNAEHKDILTEFELAFAALALSIEGYFKIFGVNSAHKMLLMGLCDTQKRLLKGEYVISKGWFRVFSIVTLGFLILLAKDIIAFLGIKPLLEWILGSVLVALILIIGGIILFGKIDVLHALRNLFGNPKNP